MKMRADGVPAWRHARDHFCRQAGRRRRRQGGRAPACLGLTAGCKAMLRLPKFRYLQPKSLVEAVRKMSGAGPEATLGAGGTDRYPNMEPPQQTPKAVIGLGQLREL